MTIYLIFAAGAVATFLLRSLMSLTDGRMRGSEPLERNLKFMSPAVLAAIVASAVFLSNGTPTAPNLVVVAAIGVGAVAARRTGNVAAAMAAGLPIYWVAALAGMV